MKNYPQLINNIVGQLNGVKKMMDSENECFKTLTQMKAARSALNSLMGKYVKENFAKCLGQCKNNDERDEKCEKYLNEIFKNIN